MAMHAYITIPVTCTEQKLGFAVLVMPDHYCMQTVEYILLVMPFAELALICLFCCLRF